MRMADAGHVFDHPQPGKKTAMNISARNQIEGKVAAVERHQTTAHVRIGIGGGVIVTSSITNEAVDDPGPRVGDAAVTIIEPSDGMVGK